MESLLFVLYVVPCILCLIILANNRKKETKIDFTIFLMAFVPVANILMLIGLLLFTFAIRFFK